MTLVAGGTTKASDIRSHFKALGVGYGTLKLTLKRLAENEDKTKNRLTFDKKSEECSVVETE